MIIGEKLIWLNGDEQIALQTYNDLQPITALQELKQTVAGLYVKSYVKNLQAANLMYHSSPREAVTRILALHRLNTLGSMVIDFEAHELVEETVYYLQAHSRSN